MDLDEFLWAIRWFTLGVLVMAYIANFKRSIIPFCMLMLAISALISLSDKK